MRTVGQLLKDARLEKGFTLEQAERATKIRAKFLDALEKDSYRLLPAFPYAQGFIKGYSDFLGLKSTTMVALFRRQYTKRDKESKPIEEPLERTLWQMTPNKVIFASVLVLLIGLGVYIYLQYQALHAKPPLIVESPLDEVVVKEEVVPVYGITDRDATLLINNEPILIKEDGKFYEDVELTVGENTIAIEATSRVGEKSLIVRRVTRAPLN